MYICIYVCIYIYIYIYMYVYNLRHENDLTPSRNKTEIRLCSYATWC